eukprot:CAMPEP_0170482402 /NCGR_PEP_ID=MMETSP0208-20121228/2439_1 /TAXON_ID=197538 /ORGANISM="Strombidium inclinatum, Strain S3" /LENGTH=56 /DNA_ID=CAMNT_0010755239 /DNA_START=19 /DNA_END=189 /DNA_ORIENTATION=+
MSESMQQKFQMSAQKAYLDSWNVTVQDCFTDCVSKFYDGKVSAQEFNCIDNCTKRY